MGHSASGDGKSAIQGVKLVSEEPTRRILRSRIQPDEESEVRFWMKEFGVTREQLRKVVKRVGLAVEDIRGAISNPRRR